MATANSGGIIQEIAFKLAEVKQSEQLQRDDSTLSETTLFVLGSQSAGKTTIINKFLDKESATGAAPRPTLALEYAFARKSASSSTDITGAGPHQTSSARIVCHVWELGGGLLANSSGSKAGRTGDSPAMHISVNINHNLCDIPMRSARHGLRQLRIMLVLDLSQPECIWSDLMASLSGLDAMFDKCDASAVQAARLRRWQLANGGGGVAEESADLGRMTLEYMPVPLLLVGGKYDVFQNFDPEIKKHICRALRSVALILGADALLFCSSHSAPQLAAVRDKLNKLTFRYHSGRNSAQQGISRTRRLKTAVIDHNQALAIELGADSWQQIGHIPKQAVADVGVMLSAHIPQRAAAIGGKNGSVGGTEDANDLPDPATDPDFCESLIDELRSQKDAELRERWRDADVREKFHSMASFAEGMSSDF